TPKKLIKTIMLNYARAKPFADLIRRMAVPVLAACATLAAAATTSVPVLRVTAPNGQQSILIGTVHVPVNGLREPAPSIFAGVRHYVVEHNGFSTLPPDEASAAGAAPDWAKSLTNPEIDIYLQRAMCAGLNETSARSWLRAPTPHEANAFAYTICPLPHATSRDVYLSSIAPAALAEHPEALEDANWVELQRRMVPARADLAGFRWALAHDPKTVLEQTRDDLNSGDYDALRVQFLESCGSQDAAAAFGKHMVDERNAEWLPRLETILNDGHAVVVVGAMHFPGPTGLIALLRHQGYAVDALEWPAANF
ncbi:MAG TPA: TraB/GumN family protein, partial [Paraburkholderia sp.]|uniref:TraB/GumN family protein n=1 Tax=Paraburkholderia sp. TaxID=1926495 RepID=UPI002B46E932